MNVLKYLPGGNLYYFRNKKNNESSTRKFLRTGFHVSYAIVGGSSIYLALILYGSTIFMGGLNNINPINSINELKCLRHINQESKIQTDKYNELTDRIFGPNGLADVNNDGRISPIEKLEAYRLIGIPEESIAVSAKPTVEDLERTVQIYEKK